MATINNFWGAETGGMEEANAFSGTLAASTESPPSGDYHYALASGSDCLLVFDAYVAVASAGAGFIAGCKFRPGSSAQGVILYYGTVNTGTGSSICFRVVVSAGRVLTLEIAGGIVVATSFALAADTYYTVEVYAAGVASGRLELFVNGASQGFSDTANTSTNSAGPYLSFSKVNSANSSYVDDIYFLSGATAASDRLGSCNVYPYRSNLNSATPDQGVALSAGTWANIQEVPFNDTNTASYTGTSQDGDVLTNDVGGSAGTGGPNTDANINGRLAALKGVWRARRGGGGGTTHYFKLGINGLCQLFTQTLTTSAANYQKIDTTPEYLVLVKGYGTIGFQVVGGQDFFMNDMLFQLLHLPSRFLPCNPWRALTPMLVR